MYVKYTYRYPQLGGRVLLDTPCMSLIFVGWCLYSVLYNKILLYIPPSCGFMTVSAFSSHHY